MNIVLHPFSILLVLVALISNILLLAFILRNKKSDLIFAAGLMVSITIWMIAAAVDLSSPDMAIKSMCAKLQFTGILAALVILLAYVLYQSDYAKWLTLRNLALISFPSLVFILLIFTNDQHALVITQITLKQHNGYSVSSYQVGIVFWIILAYIFLTYSAATAILIRTHFRSGRIFRWQTSALLSALIIPIIIFLFVDRFGLSPQFGFMVTPLVFGISVPITTILLVQLHKMDLLPFAREVVLDYIADAVIVISPSNRIVDLNKAARILFEPDSKHLVGAELSETGIQIPEPPGGSKVNFISQSEIQLKIKNEKRYFTLRITPLLDWRGNLLVSILMLNDITEIKRRTLEIGSLLEAAQAVSSSKLDLEEILMLIAREITTALSADGCTLSHWDRHKDLVETWIEYRFRDDELRDQPGTTYLLEDYPATRSVLENKKAVVVQTSAPDADPCEVEHMRSKNITSLLMLPLAIGDSVIGLVEIDQSDEVRDFSELEIRLAQALCDQAAVAIQNARLLSETQQRLYEQTVLREAGSAISSALELNVVLTQIAKQMCTAMNATSAYICDYDSTLMVSSVVAEYISAYACDLESKSDLGMAYPQMETGFFDRLTTVLHDVLHIDDPRISVDDLEHMQAFGAKSILYIPLMIKDQPVGFVEIWESRQRREFSSEEISLCQAISQQAAIALDNARLFETAQSELAERKRIEEKLYYDATHDELTGLPNRKIFMEKLTEACRSNSNNHKSFAVLFLDFDRFKVVNDSLGHAAGDKLLIESAKRLQSVLRPTDLLSRLGGDEFVILLEDIASIEIATHIADRIQETFLDYFVINNRDVFISTSIGILFDQARNQRAVELIRDADIAMYRAKDTGKARYAVFMPELRNEAIARLDMESALRQAIDNNELVVYYQPIFSLPSERLIGFEALARWNHPERAIIEPDKFIPLAEEANLISRIDQMVLREACSQIAEWHKAFKFSRPLSISVNLSGQSLSRTGLKDEIQSVLNSTGLQAEQLILEITEGAIMGHIKDTDSLLSALQRMGVKIYIDDFGTGYSSLGYLHRFRLDAIKIDRSFIRDMQENEVSYGLVSTIIKLAHTLNMTVVAEGVDSNEQKSSLTKMRCEEVQGFLYAKPMDKSLIEAQILQNVPTVKMRSS